MTTTTTLRPGTGHAAETSTEAGTRGPLVRWTAAMAMSGTIGAVVMQSGASAPAAAFARCLVGGLVLAIWATARGWLRPSTLGLTRLELGLILLGGVLLVVNWVLLFASYALSSISVSTVVYHTQPLLLVGLAALLFGEKITNGHLMRAFVAFGGVVAISLGARGVGGEPVLLSGVALALSAAMLYAGASLVAKRLSQVRPHVVAAIQLTVGAVLLAPALLFTPLPPVHGLGWLLLLGTVHTAVMYVLMYSSIGRLPTGTVAVVSYLYPVVAVIVDVLAYGHRITPVEGAGMVAVLLAALSPRRRT